jgi:hypothetical protein
VQTGFVAALIASLTLGLVECLRRFYPAPTTWRRLRRARGRLAMIRMRERFEQSATQRTPRVLAFVLLMLVIAWIGAASLLDKRWHEVVFDVVPYLIVGVAVLRLPPAMRAIAARMKDYEHEIGDHSIIEDDGNPNGLVI